MVPVYNEEDNVEQLHEQLTAVLATLGRDYETIYVDDGSTDSSVARLRVLAEHDAHVRLCVLSRNFGQTAALAAGIDLAVGDVVILIDADLQNDPQDIPMLLGKLAEGYDVVSGWRKDRKDTWLTRRVPSQMANALISRITGVHLHDYGCTLKAYRRDVLKGFRLYGEMHRFLPAYASQMGARIIELPVNHKPRLHGKSKYGLERTLKVVLDLLVVKYLSSYSNRPIHMFGGLGAVSIGASILLLIYLIGQKLWLAKSMIENPLLLMSVMFFILGSHAVFIGLLAELLNRTYHESQDKPTYVVRQVIGGEGESAPAPSAG